MRLGVAAPLVILLVGLAAYAPHTTQQGATAATLQPLTVWMTLPAHEQHPNACTDPDSIYLAPIAHDQEWLRVKMWRFGRTDTLHMSVGIDGYESDTDSLGVGFEIEGGSMGIMEFSVTDTVGNVSCTHSFLYAVELGE